MTLLKINRLLPIYISIVPLKFEVDIQSQSKVRVRKPNKANLRDLIAATGLVILLKLDSNRRVTVRKRLIWVKIDDFFSRMTLKFDIWPWKTIGHLFYTTSSFVHHFIAIGEFKLELQSGNAQSGSKSTIFLSRVTLKFDGWPWKTIGHLP